MTLNDPKDDPKYQVGGKQYKAPYERTQDFVSPQEVTAFHEKADTDSSQIALHHTIGPRHDQSAAGDHNHANPTPYKKVLAGTTITGAKSGNTALASVIAALVKLGATDSTT